MTSKRMRQLASRKKQGWIRKLARSTQDAKQEKTRDQEGAPCPAEASGNAIRSQKSTSSDLTPDLCVILKKIPQDRDEQDVRRKMARFGEVLRILMVRQKPSKTHVGTCFVYFKVSQTVEKVMRKALANESKKQPFLNFHGNPVEVHLPTALVKSTKRSEKTKGDTRNLYLLAEGQIDEKTQEISASDRAKRAASTKQRYTKLRNPNFHVSRTRLSVKNIPDSLDSKALKKLFQQFGQVKQSKILVDAMQNSKGHGFVEFLEHKHALKALRGINNNPNIWSKKNRPIIEFAIDDVTKIRPAKAVPSEAS